LLFVRRKKDISAFFVVCSQKERYQGLVCVWFPDLGTGTGVNPYDIVSTLQAMSMLKYWKGKHIVLKRQVRQGAL